VGVGPELELAGLTRRFGVTAAVDDLELRLDRGEVVTLLGPSGCGKTTALRLIAGFETPDAGAVRFRGKDVTSWGPRRRGFGMVFQNYALFPHMDVFENVAFGLRCRAVAEAEIRERVARVLALVDLPDQAERRVQQLSGGQQQRVALARALAIEPPLLLLDEPLSNLDATLRERTRTELRRLIKELGITALFVTHDQEEAFDLSDRVAVMRAGRIRQVGTPEELYDAPSDPFVAGFVGRANRLRVGLERGARRVRLAGGTTWELPAGVDLPGSGGRGGEEEARFELWIRPEDLEMLAWPSGSDRPDLLPGTILDRRFRGAVTSFRVEAAGIGILEVTAEREAAAPGDRVGLALASGARVHLFEVEGERPVEAWPEDSALEEGAGAGERGDRGRD
jgi:ABC-type Fe3+/spermidine/putrescine transport system ATPase subunit